MRPTEPTLKKTTATFHTLPYEIFLLVFAFLQLCQRQEILFSFHPQINPHTKSKLNLKRQVWFTSTVVKWLKIIR